MHVVAVILKGTIGEGASRWKYSSMNNEERFVTFLEVHASDNKHYFVFTKPLSLGQRLA